MRQKSTVIASSRRGSEWVCWVWAIRGSFRRGFGWPPLYSQSTQHTSSSTARDEEPAFSPDGKKIAFKSSRDGSEDVFVMDASGANQTNITPNTIGVFDREPDWQPKAATFTINTASDVGDGACDGTCTLREAIDASNAVLGQIPNTIKFTIQ